MKHLSSLQLCAFLDDVLVGAPDDETARHLATCAICRTRYEAWSHVDDSLRELLGQDPDEHAMEQRMGWVQIAVTAERKGLPAPEFAVLRISLPPREPAPPPVQLFSRGLAPAPGGAPHLPAPPPDPRLQAGPPREPIQRPVLRSPTLGSPAPVQRTNAASTPAPAARPPAHEQAAPAADPAGGAGRAPGYARRPHPPRKGMAGFVSRPAVWIALALVAAIAAAVPLGVARYGIPEIKFGFKSGHERDADVKPAVDATSDRADEAEPARKGSATRRKGGAQDDPGAQPDASVLFDLPALEPEDDEPDPAASEPSPARADAPAKRDAPAGSGPMLCGEVRNAQGQPVEGARVYLASPPRMVRTDKSGRFCIGCPLGKRTIRIEATGRAPVTRTVQMARNRLETRFTLNAVN